MFCYIGKNNIDRLWFEFDTWLSKNAKPQDMLKGKNTIASLEKPFLAALLLHSGLWTVRIL